MFSDPIYSNPSPQLSVSLKFMVPFLDLFFQCNSEGILGNDLMEDP